MITGFNTDIKHKGVTYHVQTEDKGLKTPLILSLVYEGGTILASKRSPYEDLVANFDEKVLEDRLNRQHNLICAAIRAGRIEDLKRMTLDASAEAVKKKTLTPEIVETKKDRSKVNKLLEDSRVKTNENKVDVQPKAPAKQPSIEREIQKHHLEENKVDLGLAETTSSQSKLTDKTEKSRNTIQESRPLSVLNKTKPVDKNLITETSVQSSDEENEVKNSKAANTIEQPPTQQKVEPEIPEIIKEKRIPKPTEEPVWDIPIIEDVTIVEDGYNENQFADEQVIMLPPEAVEIVGDLEQFGALLEQELKVKILGENPFQSGERKNINILVCRGSEDSAVADASVMVKVIGSDFRPLIYHAKADSNGVATVFLKLPTFRSGRAALLIRAMVDGEETELRRVISPE